VLPFLVAVPELVTVCPRGAVTTPCRRNVLPSFVTSIVERAKASETEGPAELAVHGLEVRSRQGAESPIDHGPLDGPEDPGHDRGEE
jgi:hypothetical protein